MPKGSGGGGGPLLATPYKSLLMNRCKEITSTVDVIMTRYIVASSRIKQSAIKKAYALVYMYCSNSLD